MADDGRAARVIELVHALNTAVKEIPASVGDPTDCHRSSLPPSTGAHAAGPPSGSGI